MSLRLLAEAFPAQTACRLPNRSAGTDKRTPCRAEPLTDRELEVGKLGAANRTQAVACARDLGLIP